MTFVFVGGAGDADSTLVQSYSSYFAKTHPGVIYFSWEDADEIGKHLDGLPPDEQINMTGHSYGGDTVGVIAARYMRPINVLITIDPVGHTRESTLRMIHNNCVIWVDVNAVTEDSFERSNLIAGIGGSWDHKPKGIAHVYIEAQCDHKAFSLMMRTAGPGGLGPEAILELNSIPKMKERSIK